MFKLSLHSPHLLAGFIGPKPVPFLAPDRGFADILAPPLAEPEDRATGLMMYLDAHAEGQARAREQIELPTPPGVVGVRLHRHPENSRN